MTIARIAPGRWELRTRYGTLICTGSLSEIVCLWSRMVKDGWCDIPYGAGEPGTTVECTSTHDCRCRACTRATCRVRGAPASQ
jgi:hypothetical protein